MDDLADNPTIEPAKKAAKSSAGNTIDYLRRTRFLRFASDRIVHRLAKEIEITRVSAGGRIVEKGEDGDAMYFVVDGMVRVHDGNVILTKLSSGAIFGEIAALSSQRRTASVTADTDCLLYVVNQESIFNIIEEQPETARSII